MFSKIIRALDTNTRANSGFIFIFISNFFFLGIIPPEGSKIKLSAFSILNKIFCSEKLFKYIDFDVSVLIVMKSKSITSGIDDRIFGHILSIFVSYFLNIII